MPISILKGSLRLPGAKKTEGAKVKAEKWVRIIYGGVGGNLEQSDSCRGGA